MEVIIVKMVWVNWKLRIEKEVKKKLSGMSCINNERMRENWKSQIYGYGFFLLVEAELPNEIKGRGIAFIR